MEDVSKIWPTAARTFDATIDIFYIKQLTLGGAYVFSESVAHKNASPQARIVT